MASSIPSGRLQWWIFSRYDTLVHIIIFFVFGILVFRALRRESDTTRNVFSRVMLMLAIVLGYGIFDELHQAITPGRSVDLKDLAADLTGGLLAGAGILARHRFGRGRSGGGEPAS